MSNDIDNTRLFVEKLRLSVSIKTFRQKWIQWHFSKKTEKVP